MKHLTDETAIIVVSGNESNCGAIINCNSSFGKLFGYTRDDLVGKDITMLMPDLYVRPHEEMLRGKKGFQTRRDEVFIICQHRNRYIFPGYLRILRMANMLNSFTYVAAISEKSPFADASRAFVLLGPELQILGVSSCTNYGDDRVDAWTMLKLSISRVKDGDTKLPTLCPEVTVHTIAQYIRTPAEVDYYFPGSKDESAFVVEDTPQDSSSSKYDNSPILDSMLRPSGSPSNGRHPIRARYRFSAGTITLPGKNLIGYYGVFSEVTEVPELDEFPGSAVGDRSCRAGGFQFRFDPTTCLFVRELASDAENVGFQRKLTMRSACREIANQPNLYMDNEGLSKSRSASENSSKQGSFYWAQESKIKILSRFIGRMDSARKDLDEAREFVDDFVLPFLRAL